MGAALLLTCGPGASPWGCVQDTCPTYPSEASCSLWPIRALCSPWGYWPPLVSGRGVDSVGFNSVWGYWVQHGWTPCQMLKVKERANQTWLLPVVEWGHMPVDTRWKHVLPWEWDTRGVKQGSVKSSQKDAASKPRLRVEGGSGRNSVCWRLEARGCGAWRWHLWGTETSGRPWRWKRWKLEWRSELGHAGLWGALCRRVSTSPMSNMEPMQESDTIIFQPQRTSCLWCRGWVWG